MYPEYGIIDLGRMLTDGLVGAWLPGMQSGAKDYSLFSNHGSEIFNPGASVFEYRPSRIGYHFNGIDEYISIHHSPSLVSARMTVSLWFYHIGDWTNYSGLIQKRIAGTAYHQYAITTRFGELYWMQSSDGANWDTLVTLPLPTANTWHHLVCTNTGSKASAYLDGILAASQDNPAQTLAAGEEPFMIGRGYGSGADQFFSGLIDCILQHNRGLSKEEATELYRSTMPGGYDGILKQRSGLLPTVSIASSKFPIHLMMGV